MVDKIDKPGNKKLDVEALKMDFLSLLVEKTIKIMLDNRRGEIMTDDNQKYGYYADKSAI